MASFGRLLVPAVCVIAFAAAAPPVHAQSQRTFVSVDGFDANTATNCGRLEPCRTFGAAMSVTNAGGEIVALDSGGYGAFTIDRPVSVVAPPGIHAAIAAAAGTAAHVAPAGSGDAVILRGLYINGVGGSVGIDFASGGALHIENCVTNGFSGPGIQVSRTASSDVARLYITNTISRRNYRGTHLQSTGSNSSIDAVISDSSFVDNQRGIGGSAAVSVGANADLALRHSVLAASTTGLRVGSQFAGTVTRAVVESCVITQNSSSGIFGTATGAGSSASFYVSNSTIAFNSTGVDAGAGVSAYSRGNNTVELNSTGNAFPSTYAPK